MIIQQKNQEIQNLTDMYNKAVEELENQKNFYINQIKEL